MWIYDHFRLCAGYDAMVINTKYIKLEVLFFFQFDGRDISGI